MFTTFNPKWRSEAPVGASTAALAGDLSAAEVPGNSEGQEAASGGKVDGRSWPTRKTQDGPVPLPSGEAQQVALPSHPNKASIFPNKGHAGQQDTSWSRRGGQLSFHCAAIPDIEDLMQPRSPSYLAKQALGPQHQGSLAVKPFISTKLYGAGVKTSNDKSGINVGESCWRDPDGRHDSFNSPDRHGVKTISPTGPVAYLLHESGGTALASDLDKDPSSIDMAFEWAPMDVYRANRKLSVTDFSGLLWCEQQVEFTLVTGKKRETVAMKSGVERHKRLELLDHDVVEVEVDTAEDALGLRMLNTMTLLDQLTSTGKAREVWIFAIASDHSTVLRGVIDELSLEFDETLTCEEVVISDTKTRRVAREPSDAQKRTSAFQLQLYRWMLGKLRAGDVDFNLVWQRYKCNCRSAFKAVELQDYEDLQSLKCAFVEKLAKLPRISDNMEVVYECDNRVFAKTRLTYCQQSTEYALDDMLAWWRGLRRAQGVLRAEMWKCKMCDFANDCTQTPLSPNSKAAAAARAKAIEASATAESDTGAVDKNLHPAHQQQQLLVVGGHLAADARNGSDTEVAVAESSTPGQQAACRLHRSTGKIEIEKPRSLVFVAEDRQNPAHRLTCSSFGTASPTETKTEANSARLRQMQVQRSPPPATLSFSPVRTVPWKPAERREQVSAAGCNGISHSPSEANVVCRLHDPSLAQRPEPHNCLGLRSRLEEPERTKTARTTPVGAPSPASRMWTPSHASPFSPPRKRRLASGASGARSALVKVQTSDNGTSPVNQAPHSCSAPPPPIGSPPNRLAAQ